MKSVLLWVVGVLACALVALGVAYVRAPVWLLDRADGILGGDQGSERVLSAASFGNLPRRKLDVWAPKGASGKKLPVIVFFYGGGWHWGERDHYGFAARAFASRGFVVVVPDYRLYPEVRFPAFLEDCSEAVRWTQANVARFGGDPQRIALAGHSAGAYNSLMLALDRQWLGDKPVKAAISLSGPADFYPFTHQNSINSMGQAPDPLATQPVTFVRKDAPPILLMHGTADTVVRVRNSDSLFAKLKAVGGVVELKRFDGFDHNSTVMALSTIFRSRLPVLDESVRFLHDHMQEEPAHADQGR